MCVLSHSVVTLWTLALQVPLWDFSGKNLEQVAFSTPGDLLDPGIESASPVASVLAGGFFSTSTTREALIYARH